MAAQVAATSPRALDSSASPALRVHVRDLLDPSRISPFLKPAAPIDIVPPFTETALAPRERAPARRRVIAHRIRTSFPRRV
jgi:hypothetical protein